MSNKPAFIKELSLPIVAAPMFLISGPQLVIECCKNGIVGTFPALNQRSSEGFEEWLIEIKSKLKEFEEQTGKKAAPFGVNLIVHPTNPRLEADVKLCVKHKVPLIITSLGAVSEVVDAIHSYGGLVFHDVIKKRHAEKAAEAGVDGLILVAAGAGGHAGTINPMTLVAEIKKFFHKTILLSGFGKELDTEAKAWKTIWSAGQGSALITDSLPVAELVSHLKSEFKEAIEGQIKVLEHYPK